MATRITLFLGKQAVLQIHPEPFIHALIELIIIPIVLAALTQLWAKRSKNGLQVASILGILPVPSTALVLFIVVAAVVPQLGQALDEVLNVLPLYILYAIVTPFLGWPVFRLFRLPAPASRAIAFSMSSRNSLVILPLALSVPGALPVLPAIIITQTLVELISELVYVRLIPKFIKSQATKF